jgi:hypothetical protein
MGKTSVKGNKQKTLFGKRSAHRSKENLSSDRDIIARRQRLLNQLVAIVQRYPVLIWSGAWVMMMALCWISVTGLLHVDTVEVERPQPQIVADEPQIPQLKPRLQAKPASSFGLLAAIAVSCGATSLLLAKQFTPTKPSQRGLVIKRPNSRSSDEVATHQPPKKGRSTLVKQTSARVATQPIVTVLSPEENHPLDWGDASLADLMDIRKQKSISNYP